MRLFLVAASVLAVAAAPAHAKDPAKDLPKAPVKAAAAAETVRYIPLYGDLLGELSADAFLKETRQGGKVVAAELDVCHSVGTHTERKDRFVIALRPEGAKLVGAGESAEKVPVSVELIRKTTGKTFAFQGSITHGKTTDKFELADLSEQTEEQFQEALPTDVAVEPAPKAFGELSPIALGVQVKRGALPELLQALRGENVRVALSSLVDSCQALRTGRQVVQLEVGVDRAPAVVAKLRALPGVTDAGWTAGGGASWAVRFAAASWGGANGLDRERLAGRIGEIAAGVVNASSRDIAWDPVTGELKLKLKRDSEVAPNLGLTDVIELEALIAPETLGTGERVILWLENATLETVDEGAGPRLALSGSSGSDGEDSASQVDTETLLNAFAAALGGQRWDSEASDWK